MAVCTALPRGLAGLLELLEVDGRGWLLRDGFDWVFSLPLDSVSA